MMVLSFCSLPKITVFHPFTFSKNKPVERSTCLKKYLKEEHVTKRNQQKNDQPNFGCTIVSKSTCGN